MRVSKRLVIYTVVVILIALGGCGKKSGNPVLNYLKNSTLKFDSKVQKDNIMLGLRDVLMLSSEDLEKMRYKDYDGNEGQWTLQTLFTKHFVPKQQGLSWGDDFYHDVKQDSVLTMIGQIMTPY